MIQLYFYIIYFCYHLLLYYLLYTANEKARLQVSILQKLLSSQKYQVLWLVSIALDFYWTINTISVFLYMYNWIDKFAIFSNHKDRLSQYYYTYIVCYMY